MKKEVYKKLIELLKPDFLSYGIEEKEKYKDWNNIVRVFLKRALLLIDSRYADKNEIIRLIDHHNPSPYYFSPDHLEEIFKAATAISEGKKRGSITDPEELKERLLTVYRNPMDTGLELMCFPLLSTMYRYALGQMNIVTGIPTHGKSEILDQLLMAYAMEHNLKFAVFSPENYPTELHLIKLVSKYWGLPFYSHGRMSEEQLMVATNFVKDHFFFIEPYEDDVSLDAILSLVKEVDQKHKLAGFIIDPWNEIEHNIPANKTETQYIGDSLTKIRRFGRKHNISPFIVAHPTKLLPSKIGEPFPVPTAYNINGGAMWFNKADNIICVYRNNDDTVSVYVQKIKFKQYGKKGMVDMLYEFKTGCYKEAGI